MDRDAGPAVTGHLVWENADGVPTTDELVDDVRSWLADHVDRARLTELAGNGRPDTITDELDLSTADVAAITGTDTGDRPARWTAAMTLVEGEVADWLELRDQQG